VQTDRQCLFILHGQRKDPGVIKVSLRAVTDLGQA